MQPMLLDKAIGKNSKTLYSFHFCMER